MELSDSEDEIDDDDGNDDDGGPNGGQQSPHQVARTKSTWRCSSTSSSSASKSSCSASSSSPVPRLSSPFPLRGTTIKFQPYWFSQFHIEVEDEEDEESPPDKPNKRVQAAWRNVCGGSPAKRMRKGNGGSRKSEQMRVAVSAVMVHESHTEGRYQSLLVLLRMISRWTALRLRIIM